MVNPRDWKHECSRQLISEKANVFSLYSMYLLGVALLEMGGQFERSIAYSLRCCIPPPGACVTPVSRKRCCRSKQACARPRERPGASVTRLRIRERHASKIDHRRLPKRITTLEVSLLVSTTIQPVPQVEVRPPARDRDPGVSTILPAHPSATPRSARRQGICKRCGGRMMMGYDEPQCITCGNADYSYTREFSMNRQNLLSNATQYVLRYGGESSALSETLVHVKVVRIRNRVGFDVRCPFCSQAMEEASLSGKRPEARERRFKCVYGHRVSLMPSKSGVEMDVWC